MFFFVFTYVDISLGVVVVVQVLRNHCSSCVFFFFKELFFLFCSLYSLQCRSNLLEIYNLSLDHQGIAGQYHHSFFWKELQVPLNTDDVSGMVCLVKMTA